jgi:hypothetical protein
MARAAGDKMINSQNEAEKFFHKYAPKIGGALCVFGDWFGRPHDNWHRVKTFEVKDNYLKLEFNEDETLEVWNWKQLSDQKNGFIIQSASRVRWEWFYYGRPKIPENRFFIEHEVESGIVSAKSNVNWYSPNFNSSLSSPAVSIGGI